MAEIGGNGLLPFIRQPLGQFFATHLLVAIKYSVHFLLSRKWKVKDYKADNDNNKNIL